MLKIDFCSKFNYPNDIRRLLEKTIDALDKEGVLSVIALGSLPRGELSYRIENGVLILFSDIELMVVTKDKICMGKQIVFFAALNKLKKEFQKAGPLFDITVEFVSLRDFKRLPFKVRFYDMKRSGAVIYGQDVMSEMPEFTARDLDREDTNNIILRRLLAILLYLPKELIEKRITHSAEDVFKYVLARNAMDIATVALFRKGVFLPTYREKVEYVASHPDDFINDFGPDLPGFLTKCLGIKLRTDLGRSVTDLFGDTVGYFRSILSLILKDNGVSMDPKRGMLPLIGKSAAGTFGEKDITRTKFELVLRSDNVSILQKRVRAVSSYSILGCMAFFLLNIDGSACLFLKGDRRCLSVLDDSWWTLTRLGVMSGTEALPMDFAGRFLYLRGRFFSDFYVKFMAPAMSERVTEILAWRYE